MYGPAEGMVDVIVEVGTIARGAGYERRTHQLPHRLRSLCIFTQCSRY